ncbi:hypothetical protein CMQ_4358 [Grosmannia clavigera kw1407]|uniref:Atos-like conserved domain-containing protein n=1 Tax=Grosmannia clavigera (strain kw1407 / UAMH 11150) TaxID=655863 RepID=F0XUL8_GROCL|nr:uncharacterized protein CMQ_4358 [Grosmannia clavigera kw1407]EFW98506.1 hypothetical protein CMQ_4358 [Grosmannia clavigera kw1407]
MPMFEDRQDLVPDGELSQEARRSQRALTSLQLAAAASLTSKPAPIPPSLPPNTLSRRLSEESIRTELCEGPILDSPPLSSLPFSGASQLYERRHHAEQQQAQYATSPGRDSLVLTTSDRAELIERLKRGESPTWLEPLLHREKSASPPRKSRPSSAGTPTPSLLSAAEMRPEKEARSRESESSERLQEGLNIERPRSALHSGDFTHDKVSPGKDMAGAGTAARGPSDAGGLSSRPFHSSSTSWIATSPPRHYNPFTYEATSPPMSSLSDIHAFRTGMASLSSSLSSSFAYKPPTSPLVQSESNNDDDDGAHIGLPTSRNDGATDSAMAGSLRTNSRRHTLASATNTQFRHSVSSHFDVLYQPSPPQMAGERTTSTRREGAFPYQAHQPRRSLTSTAHISPQQPLEGSMPQSPSFLRPRRVSFAADTSSLQHASMVGSYEESILRGRMSTTPSKPLDFLAQIGVLGLGAKCKPNLRCPPHVTLRFSAVFYSYASTPHGRSKSEDGPSPYVGMVDLENGLPSQEAEQRSTRKRMHSRAAAQERRTTRLGVGIDDAAADEIQNEDTVMEGTQVEPTPTAGAPIPTASATRAQKRRPFLCRAPPGGSYRIPPHGQLQMIIKNQNKTAVKLFLIPYDVTGMEPGTKTFIRQRSYSAGPIVDNVPMLAELSLSERPILRYLVHLHICCPSRGRYYLYKSIRVVFANRVPDGKEKLRNELTFPEPRYSPYKPVRVMHPPVGGSGSGLGSLGGGPGAMLAMEKACRRRSSGLSFGSVSGTGTSEAPDGQSSPSLMPLPIPMANPIAGWRCNQQTSGSASFSFSENLPVDPMPLGLGISQASSTSSPVTDQQSSSYAAGAKMAGESGSGDEEQGRGQVSSAVGPAQLTYNKLNKGDVGFGGNAFAPMVDGSPVAEEGLLSQRLRSLEVQRNQTAEERRQDAANS